MKSEIYSWRLSAELKMSLEAAARSGDRSVADLLDEIARDWLAQSEAERATEDEEQERLQSVARRFVGGVAGGRSDRAETARDQIRERLASKRAR